MAVKKWKAGSGAVDYRRL